MNLMFDFVANHASIENPLVQSSLIIRHINKDHPEYESHAKYEDFVWTTFSRGKGEFSTLFSTIVSDFTALLLKKIHAFVGIFFPASEVISY